MRVVVGLHEVHATLVEHLPLHRVIPRDRSDRLVDEHDRSIAAISGRHHRAIRSRWSSSGPLLVVGRVGSLTDAGHRWKAQTTMPGHAPHPDLGRASRPWPSARDVGRRRQVAAAGSLAAARGPRAAGPCAPPMKSGSGGAHRPVWAASLARRNPFSPGAQGARGGLDPAAKGESFRGRKSLGPRKVTFPGDACTRMNVTCMLVPAGPRPPFDAATSIAWRVPRGAEGASRRSVRAPVLVIEYSCSRCPEVNLAPLLGRSRIRRDILALLVLNPDSRLHLREIARRAGTSAGTAARELGRLEATGLVSGIASGTRSSSGCRGRARSPARSPISFGARWARASVIRDALADVAGIESARIFGSYAAGRAGPRSDVDLLVVGTPDRDLLTERLEDAGRRLGRPVNEVVFTATELEARRGGQDGFVRSIDDGPVIEVLP